MSEIRKLFRLAPNAYGITIPAKYRKYMDLGFGDYVEIYCFADKTLTIKKHILPKKT